MENQPKQSNYAKVLYRRVLFIEHALYSEPQKWESLSILQIMHLRCNNVKEIYRHALNLAAILSIPNFNTILSFTIATKC